MDIYRDPKDDPPQNNNCKGRRVISNGKILSVSILSYIQR
jgi:hypothetical protein